MCQAEWIIGTVDLSGSKAGFLHSTATPRGAEINKVCPSAMEALLMKPNVTFLCNGFGICGVLDTLIEEVIRKPNITDMAAASNNAGTGSSGLGKLRRRWDNYARIRDLTCLSKQCDGKNGLLELISNYPDRAWVWGRFVFSSLAANPVNPWGLVTHCDPPQPTIDAALSSSLGGLLPTQKLKALVLTS